MIVVDTNVIAYLHLPGDQTSLAEKIVARDAVWLAPYLWRSEFRNVLALYMRQGEISYREAQETMARAETAVNGGEYYVPSRVVLRLVAQSTCSAYDCEFVALAQEFGLSLVTFDKQVLQEFPATAVAPRAFIST